MLFLFGVAALLAFMQDNWTGPPLMRQGLELHHLLEEKMPTKTAATTSNDDAGGDDDVLQVLKPGDAMPDDLPVGAREGERSTPTHRTILACLSADGEQMYAWVRVPLLLLIARTVFDSADKRFPQVQAAAAYELRALRAHQEMMEQTCASIYDRVNAVIPAVEAAAAAPDLAGGAAAAAQLFLETALVFHMYHHTSNAQAALDRAQTTLDMEVALTGALGKRTKFQVKSLPQLLLAISKSTNAHHDHPEPTSPPEQLPKTRLDKLKSRKLQRSTEQLAVVSNLFMRRAPDARGRLHNIFSVSLPPYWQLQRELAQRYITIGLHRDALVLYERLELWEGVITAHQLLNQDTTAEAIVRARLDVDPNNASLWCALGEITRKEEHFTKAWEMSGGRLTKAMRLMGLMLLRQAEHALESRDELKTDKYKRAMDCFEKCLKLNSLQAGVWFSLGCAAMRIDDHATCTRAFRRKVEIDDSDFESWNNLANGYVQLGDKRRAYFAFHESTKRAFDNWKVWENYSAIAVDVCAFSETIRSIHRLMELKSAYDDWQVLAALTQGVLNNVRDVEGRESKQFTDKLAEVMQNLRHITVSDYRVWLVAARFFNGIGSHKEAYDARRNAYQLAKAAKGWEKDPHAATRVVECLQDMVEGNAEGKAVKEMNSCKLMIKGVAKTLSMAVDKGYGGEEMQQLRDRTQQLLDTAQAFVEQHKE
ncbi:hypothetical protein PTSG_08224 [Salpingoeca rosetta]|uniref:Uncharacterized protein n=1 Tax=Salpingoeca rosetta (strain ATCC 50818 / BSB-021) TaxID=946362 RepID=F2UIC8_SALR5|nr:uncharacterized protein PTSG_08224 [Salpingoeca rosetta]EGD76877.1 hypothetical protein PTSG_08224 [Salpingoeca rosetta]|eukprot:XP_004991249.1 hypothetical protein PTSG_08224 [Salpingoeca rosetta]